MKQTLATLLATVLLLVSLVGCGEKKGNNTVTPPPAATDHDTADNSRKSHDTPGADRRNAAARETSGTGSPVTADTSGAQRASRVEPWSISMLHP